MASNQVEQVFKNLKEELVSYVDLHLKLLKLDTYEQTGRLASLFTYGLLLVLSIFFVTLFIFIGLGALIGELIGHLAAGFGVVALLYCLLLAILIGCKKKLQLYVMNTVIAALRKNETGEENEGTEKQSTADESFGETESRQECDPHSM